MFPEIEDWLHLGEFQEMQATALDKLESCVKEAKNVVQQTQTKMDELEKSIDEMKDLKKDTNLK